jgi:ParB family transcriptional regulator, chromosome partitioning protein
VSRAGRARLGKGLGALLGEDALRPRRDDPGVRSIARERIVPNPFQPRREFDEDALRELEDSIRENGLLQPLVVRPDPGAEERFQLVAGERRFRAITRLGWATVPAAVREVDDRTLLVLALVENIQRAELGPLEEAEGFQSLVQDFGFTQGEVAAAVGKSRSSVANILRLLRLPPSVRRMLADGSLSMGHARALLALEHPGRMAELARRAVDEGWTVRQVEAKTRRKGETEERRTDGGSEDGRVGGTPARNPVIQSLERALEESLGTRVAVRAGKGGSGEIRIPFRSGDDFERIFELITGEEATDIAG